jgi:hypothetical protein
MNHYSYAILALDIARERSAEAERDYLATQLTSGLSRTSGIRRLTARIVAAFSRGSAWIVRRLDGHVADDLGRTLAPAE